MVSSEASKGTVGAGGGQRRLKSGGMVAHQEGVKIAALVQSLQAATNARLDAEPNAWSGRRQAVELGRIADDGCLKKRGLQDTAAVVKNDAAGEWPGFCRGKRKTTGGARTPLRQLQCSAQRFAQHRLGEEHLQGERLIIWPFELLVGEMLVCHKRRRPWRANEYFQRVTRSDDETECRRYRESTVIGKHGSL